MKINVSKAKAAEVTVKLTTDEAITLVEMLKDFPDTFSAELRESILEVL